MPYEIVYFGGLRGRAHPIVLLFKDQGVAYEYNSVNKTWADIKPTTPLGQVPVLKDGNFQIGQSGAIMRHLARKHDLDGKTPEEQTRADMVYEHHADLRNNYVRMIYTNYEDGKEGFINELPQSLAALEKALVSNHNGTGYFVGDSIKYVDYSIFDLLDNLLILAPTCLDAFPNLKSYHGRVADRPNIKAYRATPEFSALPVNGNGKQ